MFSNYHEYNFTHEVESISIGNDNMIKVFQAEKLSQNRVYSNDDKRLVTKLPIEYRRDKNDFNVLNDTKSQFIMKFCDTFVYTRDNFFYTINNNEVTQSITFTLVNPFGLKQLFGINFFIKIRNMLT